jgi:hypothetical protein
MTQNQQVPKPLAPVGSMRLLGNGLDDERWCAFLNLVSPPKQIPARRRGEELPAISTGRSVS